MGSNIILATMALMVLFSVSNNGINEKTNMAVTNSYGYAKTLNAALISQSAVDIARTALDNGAAIPSRGSFNGGTFTCQSSLFGDTLRLLTASVYDDTTYRITANFLRIAKPFPDTRSCVALFADPLPSTYINTGLSLWIDTRNFDSTGVFSTTLGGTSGIAVISKTDSATISGWVTASSTKLNTKNKPIAVLTTGQAVTVHPALPSPSQFTDEYLAQADSSFTSRSIINGTRQWGTAASPAIISVYGDSSRTASVGGTIEGWGVLDLRGNVAFTGSLKWHGLVIAHNNAALDFSPATVNPLFVGTMLLDNVPTGVNALKGSALIEYSSAAVAIAQNMRKLQSYKLLSWYE